MDLLSSLTDPKTWRNEETRTVGTAEVGPSPEPPRRWKLDAGESGVMTPGGERKVSTPPLTQANVTTT